MRWKQIWQITGKILVVKAVAFGVEGYSMILGTLCNRWIWPHQLEGLCDCVKCHLLRNCIAILAVQHYALQKYWRLKIAWWKFWVFVFIGWNSYFTFVAVSLSSGSASAYCFSGPEWWHTSRSWNDRPCRCKYWTWGQYRFWLYGMAVKSYSNYVNLIDLSLYRRSSFFISPFLIGRSWRGFWWYRWWLIACGFSCTNGTNCRGRSWFCNGRWFVKQYSKRPLFWSRKKTWTKKPCRCTHSVS